MGDTLTLDGRAAIVTGAGNGLGRAEAFALAAAGARLILNDLPGDAVHQVAEEIRAAGGEAVVSAGDAGEWPTGQQLVAAALGAYGRLDILVNNAGVLRDRMIFTMSAEEWDLVMRVHLRGHFVTTRFATAHWREQSKRAGGPTYGRIVNTSSEAFLLGSPGQPNYATAKAGIAALTVTTARSCGRYGVLANAICPRARTAMTAGLMGPPPDAAVDPLDPRHVAPLVVHLASPAAAGINGEVFVVHGGVAAVMRPPTVREVFLAAEHGSADGMWTLESVRRALGPLSAASGAAPGAAGFACEDTLALATETIGFTAPEAGRRPMSGDDAGRAGQPESGRGPARHRDRIAMTPADQAALLAESRKLQLATINRDGTPHLVTMFYVMLDGQIAFWTYRSAQKARNLVRDPRVTCLVEAGEEYFELRGVQVVGTVRRIEDPARVLDIGRRLAAVTMGMSAEALEEYTTKTARKRVGFVVEPRRIISWDFRKLARPGG